MIGKRTGGFTSSRNFSVITPQKQRNDAAPEDPHPYRKRLSRAREKLRGFLAARCGIVNPEASCRCARQVGPALAAGKIAPDRLLFAHHPERPLDTRALLAKTRELEDLHASVQLYRSHPDFQAPESVAQAVRELLSTRPPSLLLD